jgi:hypothetical protein
MYQHHHTITVVHSQLNLVESGPKIYQMRSLSYIYIMAVLITKGQLCKDKGLCSWFPTTQTIIFNIRNIILSISIIYISKIYAPYQMRSFSYITTNILPRNIMKNNQGTIVFAKTQTSKNDFLTSTLAWSINDRFMNDTFSMVLKTSLWCWCCSA